MKIRTSKSEKGIALAAVVAFVLVFTILGFSVLNLAKTEIILARQEMNSKKAFYTAEAGIEYGVAMLNKLLTEQKQALSLDGEGDIVDRYEIILPAIEGYVFDVFTIEKIGAVETEEVESGPFEGMEAFVQRYKITSQASSDTSEGTSARLVQWVEDQGFYLFQFAVLYEQALEMHPGSRPMSIAGKIHSNSDIYLTTKSKLSIDSHLTSAGTIYHDSINGDRPTKGTVQIKDADGYYQEMDFDSSDPDWESKALETWGGKVKSQVHEISTLQLPIPEGVEPIEIIKRGDAGDSEALKESRLYHQADLRIIDGVAYDKSGNVVDLTYQKDGSSENPVDTGKSFRNNREARDIRVTEIDVSKLVESGKLPANGILYVSTHGAGAGKQDGVRLVNGSVLPTGGLTVATDNPLYIQGDYNLNKMPSAVFSDAMNILSNSWQDGMKKNMQKATNTEVNTCLLSGHSPTTDAGYGGGLENLPRFLENWSGKKFTASGSMNSLWYSEIATGEWDGNYYKPPQRDWSFEGHSSNLPAGTPILYRSQRSTWERE
jgi:hypothetical protein